MPLVRLTKIASVMTSTRVFAEVLLSSRVRYPIVSPAFSPSSSAIRSAAARAATRRGLRRITCPEHQSSPSNAGATAVVFPAPGGATRTAAPDARSAASSLGKTAWMGRP